MDGNHDSELVTLAPGHQSLLHLHYLLQLLRGATQYTEPPLHHRMFRVLPFLTRPVQLPPLPLWAFRVTQVVIRYATLAT